MSRLMVITACLLHLVQGSRYSDPYEIEKLVVPLVLVATVLLVMLTLLIIFYFRRRQTKLCCQCLCCREFRSKHTQMLEEGCPCAAAVGLPTEPIVLRKRISETRTRAPVSVVNGCAQMCTHPRGSLSDITLQSDPCDKCTKVCTMDSPPEILVEAPCCQSGFVNVTSGDGTDRGLVLSLTKVAGNGSPESTEQLLSCYSSKNFDVATAGCPCVRYGKCPAKLIVDKGDTNGGPHITS